MYQFYKLLADAKECNTLERDKNLTNVNNYYRTINPLH